MNSPFLIGQDAREPITSKNSFAGIPLQGLRNVKFSLVNSSPSAMSLVATKSTTSRSSSPKGVPNGAECRPSFRQRTPLELCHPRSGRSRCWSPLRPQWSCRPTWREHSRRCHWTAVAAVAVAAKPVHEFEALPWLAPAHRYETHRPHNWSRHRLGSFHRRRHDSGTFAGWSE